MSALRTSRTHLDVVLTQIWETGKADVRAQLEVVERAVAAAVAGDLGDELRELAARDAHKLAGSVGTLGFAGASKRARELELGLAAGTPSPARAAVLADAVLRCHTELFGDETADPKSEPSAPNSPPEIGGDEHRAKSVDLLIVDHDHDHARRIAAEARARGLLASLAPDLASARRVLRLQTPAVVLLDLALGEGVDAALDLLSETAPDRPVLVVTDPARSVDRVEIARRGGRGFLPHSLTAIETVDAVISLRQRLRPAGTRVLAVDDDRVMLDAIEISLNSAGIELMKCSDPARFWELLEEYEPDLVMLDFEMPGISGTELCRSLRNDQRWAGMPVLFLTSRGGSNAIQELFDAGADDYVRKPFVGPELLARISNRLERVRLYRDLADVDALTGALNRRRSAEDIERLLRLADRARQPVSLCVLDVDNFKRVNDGYGHPAGDAVLRGLGAALHRFLRGDDVIARWGGDEFVVAMYGMSGADGRQRVGEFVEGIRGIRFDDVGEAPVTMSAGLAEYPSDASDLKSLYRTADEALYTAKQEGRDRVVHRASRGVHGADVLIVEDNPALGGRVEQALQTRGYRTRWISDRDGAAAALAGDAPIPATLLLLGGRPRDLPAGTVLDLIMRAGTLARCRVIMFDRHAPERMISDALTAGKVECVPIPCDVSSLMQLVRSQ
jgi:diguanylate cyclase (GGDEF)-like protein